MGDIFKQMVKDFEREFGEVTVTTPLSDMERDHLVEPPWADVLDCDLCDDGNCSGRCHGD